MSRNWKFGSLCQVKNLDYLRFWLRAGKIRNEWGKQFIDINYGFLISHRNEDYSDVTTFSFFFFLFIFGTERDRA